MSSKENVLEQKAIEESTRGDPEKENEDKPPRDSPQFDPNLPPRVQDILKQTDQNGKSFRQGTTRSPFFVPLDESKSVQSALKRGEWKTLESKSIRSDKIGQPVPFTKDGIKGHLFFMEKSFAKKFANN